MNLEWRKIQKGVSILHFRNIGLFKDGLIYQQRFSTSFPLRHHEMWLNTGDLLHGVYGAWLHGEVHGAVCLAEGNLVRTHSSAAELKLICLGREFVLPLFSKQAGKGHFCEGLEAFQ